MKNYILFSTNDSRAIDNVSFVIETSMDRNEAIEMIADACKFSNFTVSPVGAPLSATVFDMEHALGVIKSLKLHRRVCHVVGKEITIVTHARQFDFFFSLEENKVVVTMGTVFDVGNVEPLLKEHEIISRLLEEFGPHLAYHKTRQILELVPYEDKERNEYITYSIVDGDVVRITKKLGYEEVEI